MRKQIKCKNCGEFFLPKNKRGPKPKYCSKPCIDKFSYKKRKKERKRICKFCGEEFYSVPKQKYCSHECRGKVQRTIKGTIRKCVVCGNNFEITHKDQDCCSQKCGSIKGAETTKRQSLKVKITCEWCGKDFITFDRLKDKNGQRFCSRKCQNANWSRKRRAMVKDLYVEDVSIGYLLKRDKGVCQICGKKVSPEKKFPHPDSPTMDHIIPLSKKGKHSKRNCQLTHWKYNLSKGNRSAGSKLRLFG